MNNMNMAGMNSAGGPVGGMPMINNGPAAALRNSNAPQDNSVELLNTYIYDYFLRLEMWEPARAMINTGNVKPNKANKTSPRRRQDADGSTVNGVDDADSKDTLDVKLPDDLPPSGLPSDGIQNSFLHDWWSLFWDIFGAQRGKQKSNDSLAYVQNSLTQQRMLREAQVRQMNPQMQQYQAMMRMQQGNNRGFGQNEPLRKALQNSRNATPAQLQQLKNQEMLQQSMRREGSDVDINGQRPQSPSSADNAPSPKRQRLEGAQFNGEQMRNGMGQSQMANQQVQNTQAAALQNAARSQQILMENGINPSQLSRSQFNSFQQQNPTIQAKSIQVYNQNLATHHNMAKAANGMPGQGSPMMQAGPDGQPMPMGDYYSGPPGPTPRLPPNTQNSGNHALQDYQMQLILLEQQNKQRLLMARAEQAGGGEMRQDQQPGQANFTGMSPQGSRNGPSPNPSDQMKRGTPKSNQAGVPGSPLGDGMPQSRDSPNGGMAFGPNGVTPDMMQFMPNGHAMRPPSSHPPGFPQNPTPQQVEAFQQAHRANQQNWQRGPGGQPMMQNPSQDGQQMTPQQRNAMPPPQVVPAGNNGSGRTQPSPPDSAAAPPTSQPANKAAPKSKKERTAKKPTKKGSAANLNAGATPSSEAEAPTPTPATPITPMHRESFNGTKGQNGTNGTNANGQTATTSAPPAAVPSAETSLAAGFSMEGMDATNDSLMFADPTNEPGDVFANFDFDPFLEGESMNNILNFDATTFPFDGGVETGAGDV